MLRALSILLALTWCDFAAAAEVKPAADEEIAAFLGGVEIPNVRWTKYDGSDFKLYYCIAESPRAGVAGLHLSQRPILTEASRTGITIEGSLGRFAVKWIRRVIKDGSRQAETVVQYSPKGWVHVLIEAPDEVGLLRFINEFGRLAIFAPAKVETRFVGPGFIDSGLRSERVPEPASHAAR